MNDDLKRPVGGYVAMVGGGLGLVLAPFMVMIKYMTGWAIIPEPAWVGQVQTMLGGLLQFAAPPVLWTVYGSVYTVALVLMLLGFVGLSTELRHARGQIPRMGFWVLVVGLCLVIPGDAIHTWTWHQNGLTVPTPGTNPLPNTAYAVHMMGMNIVMLGSVMIGVVGLWRKTMARWLAWMFVLVFPSAVLASVTFLPTTPSGALWLFCIVMMAYGYLSMTGRSDRLVAA